MRIAIVGSWRHEDKEGWGLRDRLKFGDAMKALGAELAALGHRLVVATLSSHTADGVAARGALTRLPETTYGNPVIDLFEREASHTKRGRSDERVEEDDGFRQAVERRPGFVNLISAPPERAVIKLHQVDLADAVLAVGGAEKTLQAAMAAAVSGKRIVPVGAFGGAALKAAEIFSATEGHWGAHVPPQDVLGPLRMPWAPGSVELVLRALGVRAPKILIVHGRDLKSRDVLVKRVVDLGLPAPTVMAAAPTLGRALPEKFEQLALQVDAAIALVTPDDVGGLRRDTRQRMHGRARQNVWVEVGWFWGRLGRARVLLVGKRGVEVPSDLSGLLIEEFEDPSLLQTIANWIESLGWPKPPYNEAKSAQRTQNRWRRKVRRSRR